MADRVEMLASEIENLRVNLREVRRRLERVEGAVGLSVDETPRREPVFTPPAVAPPIQTESTVSAVNQPSGRGATLAGSLLERRKSQGDRDETHRKAEGHTSTGEGWSLERLVGGRAFGVVGSLIVVIGAALFLKLAYDEGWLGRILPVWRCVIAAVFGLGLIGLGELLRHRLGALASTGISAAGIATLYATVFTAHALFGLLGDVTATTLLVSVTMAGIALGAIGRRSVLGILSLVGAYLAPLVIGGVDASQVFFPVYLLALLCFGLVLGGWLGRGYAGLRSVAWWGTVLLGTLWIVLSGQPDAPANALVFVGMVWLVTQLELLASSRFMPRITLAQLTPSGLRFARQDDGEIRLFIGNALTSRSAWLVSCFGSTLWALLMGLLVVVHEWPEWDFMAPASLCAGTLLVSVLAWKLGAGQSRSETRETASAGTQLGSALVIQSAGLVIATVAFGLSEWLQVSVWLGLGLASIIGGARVRCSALRGFGAVLLGIALVRLVTMDLAEHLISSAGSVELLGLHATAWSVQMLCAGIAWLIAGMMMSRLGIARACGVIGMGTIALAMLGPGSEIPSIAIAWSVLVVCGWGLSRVTKRLALLYSGAAIAFLAGCAWALEYASLEQWTSSGATLLLHPGLGVGLVVVASQIWIARAIGLRAKHVTPGTLLLLVGIALSLMATSYEVHRVMSNLVPDDETARRGAVSLWWAACGVGALVIGWLRRHAPSRWFGLILLGSAALKLILVDLTTVSALWRIVGSLAIGLTMLGVAVAYARRSGSASNASRDAKTEEQGANR